MSLFKDREEKYRKTIRILVYPNITFQEDLEKDSYIQVIKNQIKLLNEIRDDLWFYLILPEPIPSLIFDNVSQYYVDFPTYPPAMRSHFVVPEIAKIVNQNKDFDLVMSHLPEHTHAVKNVLYNLTHHVPNFFGYCHWFDFHEVVGWPQGAFNQNITGLLEYDRCYLNTQHQKDMVLHQAKEIFNKDAIINLKRILTVQHLGVDEENITGTWDDHEKIIVFNHRPDTYKHFDDFIEVTDALWEQRKDFKVWIPLLAKSNREYVTVEKGNKEWYYKKLQSCCVGYSPEQDYGGWSVATTDGMMNGVPYIMFDDTYYHELWSGADFFKTTEQAVSLLNKYLNSYPHGGEIHRSTMSVNGLHHIHEYLIYKDKIKEMSNYITDLNGKHKYTKESERLNQVITWVQKEKRVTKKDIIERLGWGRGIKWTPYRQALLKHPNIYDVMDEYPAYCWRE
jgi:hypothetical protein